MYWTAKFGDPAKSGVRSGSQKPSPAGHRPEARLQSDPALSPARCAAGSVVDTLPPGRCCVTVRPALLDREHTPGRLEIWRFVPPVLSLQLPKSNRQTLPNSFHIKPCAISDLLSSNRHKPRRCHTQTASGNPSRPAPKSLLKPRTLRSKDLSYIAWNVRGKEEIAEARIRRGPKASDIICSPHSRFRKDSVPQTEELFKSFTLNGLTLPNRIVMAPMTRNHSPGGVPGADVAAYYRRRAEGGAGLILTEGTAPNHPQAKNMPDVPHMYGDEALAGWARVVEGVHAAGGRIFSQLWHVGAVQGHSEPKLPRAPISPSGLLKPDTKIGEPMTESEVEAMIEIYGQAAADAQRVGFDGIELHGAHEIGR